MKYKKKFGGGNDELVKVAKLKKVEQGARTIKEIIIDRLRWQIAKRNLDYDLLQYA